MSRTSYYYSCGMLLGDRSVIKKGNWGRGINLAGEKHGCWKRETILEKIRKELYSDRPSRLDCVFLCPTITDLRRFLEMNQNRWFDTLYEVELFDPRDNVFETYLNSCPDKNDPEERIVELGHQYWKGVHVPNGVKEILVDGDVRVLKHIDRYPQQRPTSSASLPF